MFKKLTSLFVFPSPEKALEKSSKNEYRETKKCKKCLRRIELKYEKCPYCGCGDFHYDDS